MWIIQLIGFIGLMIWSTFGLLISLLCIDKPYFGGMFVSWIQALLNLVVFLWAVKPWEGDK